MTQSNATAPYQIDPVLVEMIKDFPQSSFTTRDGRKFGLFFCGTFTLMRLELKGVFADYRDKAGLERLKDLPGFILETSGGTHQPQIYHAPKDLLSAWERLVRLTVKQRIANAWNVTLLKCKQEHLSRRVRAAASMTGMVLVTALSIMMFHYGHAAAAFAYESMAIAVYAVWVSIGKDFGPPEMDEAGSDSEF